MLLKNYIDPDVLSKYVEEGLVDFKTHPTLPLRLYCYSRCCTLGQLWDEVTTKTRGLITDHNGSIIARPFEKFFNINTIWRPETCLSNLPRTLPFIAEKLDGSLGVLYTWEGKSAIATKGSFISDQAIWATAWYDRFVGADEKLSDGSYKWPQGFTPVFEIIAESVQHHVVHYDGREELVLIALINNVTGEEIANWDLAFWATRNGIRSAKHYIKTLGDVLNEDRKNAEGYVLSWPLPGQPPLKVKIKHESFLVLQKVVHAATPKAILEALVFGNVDLLNTWIGQTNNQLGQWVQEWVAKFNLKYGTILLKSKLAANMATSKAENRKEFAEIIHAESLKSKDVTPGVCFVMFDGKDHKRLIWKAVEKAFTSELSKPFALIEEDTP